MSMYNAKPQYRKERRISSNDSWRIRTVEEVAFNRGWPYKVVDPEDCARTIFFMTSDREWKDILLMTGLNEV